MMKNLLLGAALAVFALPALAQDTGRIRQTIVPMLQESAPGKAGEVLADCVIANATSSELSALGAASGPSRELGALITSILSRDATIACFGTAAK